jgi:lipoate-protein ligase A
MVGVQIIRDGRPDQPVLEVALSEALLMRVARGELPATLRLYRPGPTVAFGRLDALRAGYGAAAAAAAEHGFTPVLRSPGGHAAAYDAGTVGFDLVLPNASVVEGVQDRFRDTSQALARALTELGVDARVGPVPGEYCAGDYTVNARGARKLVGTAQRAIRGAALLGGFVTVSGSARLRAVLEPVYAALAIDWDPASLGAVDDEVPEVTLAAAEQAVLEALAGTGARSAAELDAATLALAQELRAGHAVRPGGPGPPARSG